MKTAKRFMILLFTLAAFLFPARGAAAEAPLLSAPGSALSRMADKANVWSAAVETEYEQTAAAFAETYQTDAVLLSVYVLQDSSLGDRVYGSAGEFAKDYYEANGFGCGEEKSGTIFVFCREAGNRQAAFYAAGRESRAYSEEDAAFVEQTLQPYLEGGDYDGAARRYLELVQAHEEQGKFDLSRAGADSSNLLWTFGLALLVAWAITSNMRRRMNPVQKATAARNYTVKGSYELRRYNEIYLGTTVTRQPRSQNRQPQGGFGGPAGGRRP